MMTSSWGSGWAALNSSSGCDAPADGNQGLGFTLNRIFKTDQARTLKVLAVVLGFVQQNPGTIPQPT